MSSKKEPSDRPRGRPQTYPGGLGRITVSVPKPWLRMLTRLPQSRQHSIRLALAQFLGQPYPLPND